MRSSFICMLLIGINVMLIADKSYSFDFELAAKQKETTISDCRNLSDSDRDANSFCKNYYDGLNSLTRDRVFESIKNNIATSNTLNVHNYNGKSMLAFNYEGHGSSSDFVINGISYLHFDVFKAILVNSYGYKWERRVGDLNRLHGEFGDFANKLADYYVLKYANENTDSLSSELADYISGWKKGELFTNELISFSKDFDVFTKSIVPIFYERGKVIENKNQILVAEKQAEEQRNSQEELRKKKVIEIKNQMLVAEMQAEEQRIRQEELRKKDALDIQEANRLVNKYKKLGLQADILILRLKTINDRDMGRLVSFLDKLVYLKSCYISKNNINILFCDNVKYDEMTNKTDNFRIGFTINKKQKFITINRLVVNKVEVPQDQIEYVLF